MLSSDLPFVTPVNEAASPATAAELGRWSFSVRLGRGGTNALYIRPPYAINLHFGGDSLVLFRHDAETRNVRFVVHHSTEMALDLDEPDDLERLRRAV